MQCSNGGEAYLGWRADILEDGLSIGPVEGRIDRGLEVKLSWIGSCDWLRGKRA